MIKSDIFYAAFEKGFASQQMSPLIVKRRGKIPKYYATFGDDEISFWFKVNSKASAFPNLPGEFWPVIETKNLRYNERDNGIVSWYQYSGLSVNDEMTAFQWSVFNKTANQTEFERPSLRGVRDAQLPILRRGIATAFEIGWPHTALYYLDERDAEFWGKLFALHLSAWLEKFCAHPETLKAYMWRVHWKAKASAG